MDDPPDIDRPVNRLATTPDLSHIREMDDPPDTDMPVSGLSTTNFLGAALPPVPHKLVERINSGAFVDMGELLPGNLSLTDDDLK